MPATDTLAGDRDGGPFRHRHGALLFRPGGHGALVRNLAALGGDIVILKNVDNVLPELRPRRTPTGSGCSSACSHRCSAGSPSCYGPAREAATTAATGRALAYAAGRFAAVLTPPRTFEAARERRDRPARSPDPRLRRGPQRGRARWRPFGRGGDGRVSVQIVVVAGPMTAIGAGGHLPRRDPLQSRDVICGRARGPAGRSISSATSMATRCSCSRKSHDGRELIALERPGLWNGAMAGWNTLCVEVPGSTFAPVKTVLDLLRPEHQ